MLSPMSENTTMCVRCKAMKDKLQYRTLKGPGHGGLERSGDIQEFRAHGWVADDEPYVCRDCGTRWVDETGNYGNGWRGGWPPEDA